MSFTFYKVDEMYVGYCSVRLHESQIQNSSFCRVSFCLSEPLGHLAVAFIASTNVFCIPTFEGPATTFRLPYRVVLSQLVYHFLPFLLAAIQTGDTILGAY